MPKFVSPNICIGTGC